MKFTLFLGAGASVPLGFPDTGMFKTNLEKLLKKDQDQPMLSMLEKSGYGDIESVLTAIEALMDLPSNPGHDLTHNTMKVGYGYIPDKSNLSLRQFNDVVKEFSGYKETIQDYVYSMYSWKNASSKQLELYHSIFSILKQSDDGIHICTTNYDQVMENYIDNNDELTRVDGFIYDDIAHKFFFQRDGFVNFQQNNNPRAEPCYLYKLHGSLNWVPHEDKIRLREMESSNGDNLVIYPTVSSKDKDYKREPYATILKKFSERIEKTDFFIIVGCSFRDTGITEKFQKFLRRDGTKMFVISPSATKDTVKVLGDEFSYCDIDFHNPAHPEWLNKYDELCTNRYNGTSIDLRGGTFKEQLDECFRQLNISYDAKVYNLVGKLEEIDSLGILDIVSLISDVASGKL